MYDNIPNENSNIRLLIRFSSTFNGYNYCDSAGKCFAMSMKVMGEKD